MTRSGPVVVVGEALIDLVPEGSGYRAVPGGSPANVAVGLARLEVPAALLARIAPDGFGRLLREHLTGSGVDLSLAATSDAPTTLAVVTLDPDGVADYSFYVDGAADGGWSAGELPDELPTGTTAVMASGSLALAVPAFDDAVVALLGREAGRRTVVVDPNFRPSLVRDPADHRRRLDRWLDLADVVKVSDADLAGLHPGVDPVEVAAEWSSRGPLLVVVTRGQSGAVSVLAGEVVHTPAVPVDVVDTVGAGDAFTAGLLAALDDAGRLARGGLARLTVGELAGATAYATRVAAITCGRPGADPPRRRELSS